MIAKLPPFGQAKRSDPLYKLIAINRTEQFWRQHTKDRKEDYFSEDFKDLVIGMLQLEPEERYTFKRISQHPWMQGPVPTRREVQRVMQDRYKIVKDKLNEDR